MAAIESEVPTAMRKVYRRLERWPSKRKGRSRIPESLWTAAGELAREPLRPSRRRQSADVCVSPVAGEARKRTQVARQFSKLIAELLP